MEHDHQSPLRIAVNKDNGMCVRQIGLLRPSMELEISQSPRLSVGEMILLFYAQIGASGKNSENFFQLGLGVAL